MTGTEQNEKRSISESRDLVTGFDEIAIEKQFKTHIEDMRPTDTIRALVWIDRARVAGADKRAAYEAVMGMTQVELVDHFLDDDAEDEDDEQGKESAPAVADDDEPLTSRPPGASSQDSPLTPTES